MATIPSAKKLAYTAAWKRKQTDQRVEKEGVVFCKYHMNYVPKEKASRIRSASGSLSWCCQDCFLAKSKPHLPERNNSHASN